MWWGSGEGEGGEGTWVVMVPERVTPICSQKALIEAAV